MKKLRPCSENWKKFKEELKLDSAKVWHRKKKLRNLKSASLNKRSKTLNLKRTNDSKVLVSNSSNSNFISRDINILESILCSKQQESDDAQTSQVPDIWFDVSTNDLITATGNCDKAVLLNTAKQVEEELKSGSNSELARIIGVGCATVKVGETNESVPGRISIVNPLGKCIFDKFVRHKEEVTDYCTNFSGVKEEDFKSAEAFEVVQKQVADMIKGKIIVGRSLRKLLKLFFLTHPHKDTRDITRNPAFKKRRKLLFKPRGCRDTVEDAQAAVMLYNVFKSQPTHKPLHSKNLKIPPKKS